MAPNNSLRRSNRRVIRAQSHRYQQSINTNRLNHNESRVNRPSVNGTYVDGAHINGVNVSGTHANDISLNGGSEGNHHTSATTRNDLSPQEPFLGHSSETTGHDALAYPVVLAHLSNNISFAHVGAWTDAAMSAAAVYEDTTAESWQLEGVDIQAWYANQGPAPRFVDFDAGADVIALTELGQWQAQHASNQPWHAIESDTTQAHHGVAEVASHEQHGYNMNGVDEDM